MVFPVALISNFQSILQQPAQHRPEGQPRYFSQDVATELCGACNCFSEALSKTMFEGQEKEILAAKTNSLPILLSRVAEHRQHHPLFLNQKLVIAKLLGDAHLVAQRLGAPTQPINSYSYLVE